MQTSQTEIVQKTAGTETPRVVWWKLVLAAVPAVSLAVFYIFRAVPGFADIVTSRFGLPLRRVIGSFCSLFPFSVMELIYTAAGLWAIYFIVKTVFLLLRRDRRLRRLLKRLFILAVIVIWIWAGFCYLWGADYFAPSFAERSGLAVSGVTVHELAAVTAYFAENASAMSDAVPRDENGSFSMSNDDVLAAYGAASQGIAESFPFLSGKTTRPKSMIYSKIMSRIGFTGIFFPFTGETNLNTDVPGCLLPFTVGHEMSHQLGIAREDECNFLGVAGCVASGDAVYEYSGWLAGLLYTSNALYAADYDAWYEIYCTYSEGVRRDFSDNNAYWAQWESPVSETAESVYDGYLKAQGQELGVRSYGSCVDLLVAHFLPAALMHLST